MITLPAYLTGFSSRSDGSAGIRFATQELTSEQFGELKENLNKFGYLAFRENKIDLKDLPLEDAEDKEKTPSKRLRAVLFVQFQQLGKKENFDQFYRESMEKFINHVKNNLD